MIRNLKKRKTCNKAPGKEVVFRANGSNCNILFLLSLYCGTMVIMRPIVCLHGVIWLHKCKFAGAFEAVLKATWVISIFPPSHRSPIQNSKRSPEDSNQRGVNGVSIIDVHVVPAALCGKVIEAQPENCIRTGRRGERRQNIQVWRKCIWWMCITHMLHTISTTHEVCGYDRTSTPQGSAEPQKSSTEAILKGKLCWFSIITCMRKWIMGLICVVMFRISSKPTTRKLVCM